MAEQTGWVRLLLSGTAAGSKIGEDRVLALNDGPGGDCRRRLAIKNRERREGGGRGCLGRQSDVGDPN